MNAKREAEWNKLTPEEQEDYVLNGPDLGNKRLDFRYQY